MTRTAAALKQREYRKRRDEDTARRAAYLTSEKRQNIRKHVKIALMTPRECRHQRKLWRKYQWNSRQGKMSRLDPQPAEQLIESKEVRDKLRRAKKLKASRKDLQAKLAAAKAQAAKYSRLADMYKHQFQREVKMKSSNIPCTPRSKSYNLIRHETAEAVRKTLTFHYSVMAEIQTKYNNTKKEREKRTYLRLFAGETVRKYRLQKFAQEQLGKTT